jgi:uncharacterized membrane protein
MEVLIMKKFDWKERFKNKIFWVNTILAVATPILAYFGINGSDLTTWGSLFGLILDALKNPYVVGLVLVSLWNNVINPVTKGITD